MMRVLLTVIAITIVAGVSPGFAQAGGCTEWCRVNRCSGGMVSGNATRDRRHGGDDITNELSCFASVFCDSLARPRTPIAPAAIRRALSRERTEMKQLNSVRRTGHQKFGRLEGFAEVKFVTRVGSGSTNAISSSDCRT